MSRNIPRVRVWRVALYNESNVFLGAVYVYAPNRRFALWNARDVFIGRGKGLVWIRARKTVGLMRAVVPRSLIHTP